MGLSSLLKRKAETQAVSEPADEVQQARTRARQRLIGAVVLLGIGIVGFPLVFETQPRPIPVDIPIEIPRKESATPLSLPPAPVVAPAPAQRASPSGDRPAADGVITESREEDQARPSPSPSPSPLPSPLPSPSPEPRTAAPKPAPDTRAAADAKPVAAPRSPAEDGARARALLEGAAPAASAAAARFVVQVGAFADAAAAHDTRQKMERLGLKTYTQVASTAAGGRIRVRVGPFTTREEADRALTRARGAGLSGVVITL